LFLAAKDEAEFAGMLAHSMVHVSERHYTREATRVALANEATVPLIFMGGWTGYGTRQGGPVLVPVGMLKFQQVAETEADTLAVAISSGAGFDPSALLRYINRVQAESPGTGGRAFAARVSNLEAAIQAQPQQTYTVADPDEFGRIQVEVRQVTPVGPRPLLKPVSDQAPTLKRQN
jgi:predicted Zn-dependent protease